MPRTLLGKTKIFLQFVSFQPNWMKQSYADGISRQISNVKFLCLLFISPFMRYKFARTSVSLSSQRLAKNCFTRETCPGFIFACSIQMRMCKTVSFSLIAH